MFLAIFVKKSLFFRSKKNLTVIFLRNYKKMVKNDFAISKERCNCEKSRNLELFGPSSREWQLITPRSGGSVQTPPHGIGLTDHY